MRLDHNSLRQQLADCDGAAESGDFAFNADLEPMIRQHATKEAAVLIGLHEKRKQAYVLLTKRTASLRTHSGQIAFPGGHIDATDIDAIDAALRECNEETGIARHQVDVLGTLPIYLSGSGFRIHPVVGVLRDGFALAPNPDEVETVFDVPLSFLLDEANHKMGCRQWNGATRYFYEMPYGEHHIWGVTAGIIRMMYERLFR